MRPLKSIRRSVLENRNTEIAENARDFEKNTKLKASETTTASKNIRQINDDTPIFQLVLPPDLAKTLEKSSEDTLNISSSSDEEDLADDNHSSSITKMGRNKSSSPTRTLSSVKSLLGENRSLVNSKESSHGHNLSTPKRHRKILYSSIQSPKNDVSSEDSDDDPFGFGKAERKIKKRKGVIIQSWSEKISDNSERSDEVIAIDKDSQYNYNVQITRVNPLKEQNNNDTDDSDDHSLNSEIDKQDRNQIEQENKESDASSENDNYQVDNDNIKLINNESQLPTENDERSPVKTPRAKNKNIEKSNATPSKARRTPNITKTTDLIALLPLRRLRATNDNDEEVSLNEEKRYSDYEEDENKSPKKGNMQSEKKKPRKIKKETLSWESIDEKEFDEKTKQARAERIRHTEDIDSFVLTVEEVVD